MHALQRYFISRISQLIYACNFLTTLESTAVDENSSDNFSYHIRETHVRMSIGSLPDKVITVKER